MITGWRKHGYSSILLALHAPRVFHKVRQFKAIANFRRHKWMIKSLVKAFW